MRDLHADYSEFWASHFEVVDFPFAIRNASEREEIILQRISQYSGRNIKINIQHTRQGYPAACDALCLEIANANGLTAAIFVHYHPASITFYKMVRQLASAEGAFFILDFADDCMSNMKLPAACLPDIILFRRDNAYCLAMRTSASSTLNPGV